MTAAPPVVSIHRRWLPASSRTPWPEVADVVLSWLAARSLSGGRAAPEAAPTAA